MKILNVKVNNITFQETIIKIEEFIKTKKPHQICTVNPEFIMAAQKDREFRDVLNNADLSVPDGAGLLWAAKYLSKKSLVSSRQPSVIKERVAGIDLVWEMAKLAEKKGYILYLLGAGPGVAEQTAITLRTKFPDLKIAGVSEGIPQLEPGRASVLDLDKYEKKLVTDICKLKTDILLVAYGAPKQDLFIAKYKKELNVPAMMGVGGSFDYISGRIPRAPIWMQKLALEWLYRLINEPKRFNRIITATIRFPWKIICSTHRK